ncbi:MAG: hypothetical protein EP323_02085 [Gammaproteobacteria bacterium]|nr:MAG: hypothetical protein EP323_02085 [Gammaproteobacteria bacterium]
MLAASSSDHESDASLEYYESIAGSERDHYEQSLVSTETLQAFSHAAHATPSVTDKVDMPEDVSGASESSGSSVHNPEGEAVTAQSLSLAEVKPENWLEVYQALHVGGLLQNTAANLTLVEVSGAELHFVLDIDHASLYEEGHQQRLAETLEDYFNVPVSVVIEVGVVSSETPQAYLERLRQERQQNAVDSLKQDPHVRRITDMFNGVLLENTIKPLD